MFIVSSQELLEVWWVRLNGLLNIQGNDAHALLVCLVRSGTYIGHATQ